MRPPHYPLFGVLLYCLVQLAHSSILLTTSMDTDHELATRVLPGFVNGPISRRATPFSLSFSQDQSTAGCTFNFSSLAPLLPLPSNPNNRYEVLAFVDLASAVLSGCESFGDISQSALDGIDTLEGMGNGVARTLVLYAREDRFNVEGFEDPLAEPLYHGRSPFINDGANPLMDLFLTSRADYLAFRILMSSSNTTTYLTIMSDEGFLAHALGSPILRAFIFALATSMLGILFLTVMEVKTSLQIRHFHINARDLTQILSIPSTLFSIFSLLVRWCSAPYGFFLTISDLFHSLSLCILLRHWIQQGERAYEAPWLRWGVFCIYFIALASLASAILEVVFASAHKLYLVNKSAVLVAGSSLQLVPPSLLILGFLALIALHYAKVNQVQMKVTKRKVLGRTALVAIATPFTLLACFLAAESPTIGTLGGVDSSQEANTTVTLAIYLFTCLSMAGRTFYILAFLNVMMPSTDERDAYNLRRSSGSSTVMLKFGQSVFPRGRQNDVDDEESEDDYGKQ